MARWFFVTASTWVALVATLATLASITAGACRTFDADETPQTGDGAPENEAQGPDAASDASTVARTRCPAPAFRDGCSADQCKQRPLYAPSLDTGREFPFGIATDDEFVFWVTQVATDSDNTAPYNGKGEARVMRVDRGGGAAIALATGQQRAQAIARAGDWVYWGAASDRDDGSDLLRVRAGCTGAECAAETFARLPIGPATRLVRSGESALFAVDENGKVVRILLTTPPRVSPQLTTKGVYPDLTSTDTEAFASSAFEPAISKIEATDNGSISSLPRMPDLADGGNPGPVFLATDCETLYALRIERVANAFVYGLWEARPPTSPLSWTRNVDRQNIFDLEVDAKYLYVGSADGYGLWAVPKDQPDAAAIEVSKADAWSIAVDDQGVYWGDHGKSASGALWMMEKPK